MPSKETILMVGVGAFVYTAPVAVTVLCGVAYYVYSGCMAVRAWHGQ